LLAAPCRRVCEVCFRVYNQGLIMRIRIWNSEKNLVPRALCQFVRLELPPSLSKTQAARAIRLQIQRLEGVKAVDFAFRHPTGENTSYPVWFWRSGDSTANAFPEPLFAAQPKQDGAAVRACRHGFELVSFNSGELYKTRWIASAPDDADWLKWQDECGSRPSVPGRPVPLRGIEAHRVPAGWRVDRIAADRGWTPARRRQLVAVGAMSSILGAAIAVTWQVRHDLRQARQTLAQLEGETGSAAVLQRKIDESLARSRRIAALAGGPSHIDALARLAGLRLLGGPERAVLVEWDVRGDDLRMQIARPRGEFSLNEFLEALEQAGFLKNARLAPNPPPGMIVIQAKLR
jgi:Tfp pilus assembly protein PilN